MDKSKIVLLFHTIRYLRPKQIFYRAYYFIENYFYPYKINKNLKFNSNQLRLSFGIPSFNSFKENSFTFLNLKYKFKKIDWNYKNFGKLWTYNLNYFDFLNQEKISKKEGLKLIQDYVKCESNLIDGLDSYPTSQRIINWIKFISKYNINNKKIDLVLFNHLILLNRRLEYHLLGNHLLENLFALLFGSHYFRKYDIYKKAKNLIKIELNEQILKDGAHFELSPMYHQKILINILDCIQLIQKNKFFNDNLLKFLETKCCLMLAWLYQVTYRNGEIPSVNDSTNCIIKSSKEIFNYSKKLKIDFNKLNLSDSGYRKWLTQRTELFIDVGNIGPDYIPGHSHADTFSFEFYYKNNPIIVDTGISTYDKNSRRQIERSTKSHNTIFIDNRDSSEIWNGFRVARRAKITKLIESRNRIIAEHNGYSRIGAKHIRSFINLKNMIIIEDEIDSKYDHQIVSSLHFHPKCNVSLKKTNIIVNSDLKISIINSKKIVLDNYNFSIGFNKIIKAKKITAFVEKKSKIMIKYEN